MQKVWFKDIGVDLGSENIRVWWNDQSEILSVPAYIALDERGSLLAVGEDARALSERNSAGIRVIQPIERGVIQDEYAARVLLRSVLGQIRWASWLLAPVMMVAAPSLVTSVQRARAERLLHSVGARSAYVIPQTLAAALGGGIPSQDASGSVVVQLGSGVVEAAAISLGGIVAVTQSEFGGKSLIEQLRRVGRERYNVDLSYETIRASMPQVRLGAAKPADIAVVGKDVTSGEPVKVYLEAKQYEPAVLEHLEQLVVVIKKLLAQIPPAITTDVVERGILLSGGMAQLSGLPLFLTQHLEVPCAMVEDPEKTVIKGIAFALNHLDDYLTVYG